MAGKPGIGDLAAMGLGNVGIGPLKVGNVLDTVDFVKKAWTSFGVPSGFTPTVDLEELDQRIADLKAVEQWLTLNMNMLQGTIQALEIQRGTIATLKAFSAPLGAAAPAAQAFASVLGRATQSVVQAGATPNREVAGDARSAPGDTRTAAGDPKASAAPTSRATRVQPARRRKRAAPAAEPGDLASSGVGPGAWWNLLQSQFNQVAAAALSGVGLGNAGPATSPRRDTAPAARGQRHGTHGTARTDAQPASPAATGRKPTARARKA